jgi:hypothetical protein
MRFLIIFSVMWRGYASRPSPWVYQKMGQFSDQAACTAAANAIMAAPSITQPLPMAPKSVTSELTMICTQSATRPAAQRRKRRSSRRGLSSRNDDGR